MSIQQVGRYTLQGKLGQGGMAAVYRGHDPRFKREVAVKILPSEFLNTASLRERFEREAQIIAMLEHPAIVPVYDYGEEGENPYLVMRLMGGGSLADRLTHGPLDLTTTVRILERLAPALDHAHSLHIVHRDLKPGNILFDAFGNPYISDFGLARIFQSSSMTSKTGLMGTPDYMAPEQVLGDKPVDGRSDIYALGVIVYQMLTGRVPYDGDTPMSVAFKHVTEAPPRLSVLRPDLAPAFEALVTQAMAKDPAARFQSAAALLMELQRAVGVQPTAPKAAPAATMLEVGPGPTVAPRPQPSPPQGYNQPAPSVSPRPPSSPPVSPPSPPLGYNQGAPNAAHPPTPMPVQAARPAKPASSSRWLLIGVAVVAVLGLGVIVLGGAAVAAYSYFTSLSQPATSEPGITDEPGITGEPEVTPDEGGTVLEDVAVTEMRAYVDIYGYYHVTGLIYNNSDGAATNIELTLRVTNGDGDSVLPADDVGEADSTTFNPLVYTVAEGEAAPFDYYFDSAGADVSDWQPEVELTNYEGTDVLRAEVDVINDRVYTASDGSVWLTGELVNLSDSPVVVNTVAGALIGGDGYLVAADASYNATRYLKAAGDPDGADRTPFSISIEDAADEYDSVTYYFDADQTDALNTRDLTVSLQNAYVDDDGNMHLYATVTNSGEQSLAISLVAGLYDADGVVLDAAFGSLPMFINPDETLPVYFDYFIAIVGDSDQVDAVDTYTIQVDHYWTYEANMQAERLSTSAEESYSDYGVTTFTGQVDNTSSTDLMYATVILAVYDADNNLYTANSAGVYPDGDIFAAGESLPFEISVNIPADVDTSDFTFFTYVEGYAP